MTSVAPTTQAAGPNFCGQCQKPFATCQVSAAAISLLDQCAAFIGTVAVREFGRESRTIRGGTIGKHIRHTLDHFRACLDGAEPGQVVEYDRRQRDVPMETDPGDALRAIHDVRHRLLAVGDDALRRPVRVRAMITSDGVHAELASTLGRELVFASHHAVHHHAMLAAIAAEFGIRTPPEFGKAPATINHDRGSR